MTRYLLKPVTISAVVICITMVYASIAVHIVEKKHAADWTDAIAFENQVLDVVVNDIRHNIEESYQLAKLISKAKDLESAFSLIGKARGLYSHSIIAILDIKGNVLFGVGLDYNGVNVSYRRYFKDAVKYGRGIEYITGVKTGMPGLVASYKTTINDKEYIITAKTPKRNLQEIIDKFATRGRQVFAFDEYGVIYLNSRDKDDLLMFDLKEPTPELIQAVKLRYRNSPIKHFPVKIINEDLVEIEGFKYLKVATDFLNEGRFGIIRDPAYVNDRRSNHYLLVIIVYLFGVFMSGLVVIMSVIQSKR